MDAHDKAHYAIGVGLAAAIAFLGFHHPAPAIAVSSDLAAALKAIQPRPISIYCVPSSCDLADRIADQFDSAGWKETVTTALAAQNGVGVRGGEKLRRALEQAIGLQVKFDPTRNDDPWQIWIGSLEEHGRPIK